MNKLTLGQRIIADEPVFFKIVKILCFIAVAAAGAMARYHIGSPDVQQVLAIGGISGYGVAQFVVKDANLLINQGVTLQTGLQVVTDVENEIAGIKAQIEKPGVPALPGLADAVSSLAEDLTTGKAGSILDKIAAATEGAAAKSNLSVVTD